MKPIILLVAQGFGIGRIPFAPGTFGSLLGIGWFALLLWPGNPWVYVVGTLAGLGVSVWLCDQGEKILGKTDPGSVVMDEVTAIPVCFGALVAAHYLKHGALPTLPMVFSRSGWIAVGTVFACFRFFDIAKPWPVRQSQALPGGWGVTVDDILAALYTAAASYLILRWCGRATLG